VAKAAFAHEAELDTPVAKAGAVQHHREEVKEDQANADKPVTRQLLLTIIERKSRRIKPRWIYDIPVAETAVVYHRREEAKVDKPVAKAAVAYHYREEV
jgi:elongation factor P--beta-lysine ligase